MYKNGKYNLSYVEILTILKKRIRISLTTESFMLIL